MPNPTATIFLPYHALDEVIQRGTRAAQPAATAVTPGTLYGVIDEGNRIERSDGMAWALYSPTAGGGALEPHHATHETGGTDALAALSASILTSGTLPDARLSGNVQLKPIPAADLPAHATRHQSGGADVVTVTALAGYPGGTATFLRADGTFAAPPTGGVPSAHATTHQPGGSDAMAVDAVAATGSLRTLGTGAQQAAAGTDLRFSDARIPTAHHATHEPGGADALTALDAGTLTTGTLPDARLSANVARRDQANTFTQDQTVGKSVPILKFIDTSQPANQRYFEIAGYNQELLFQSRNDAETVVAGVFRMTRAGDIFFGRDFYEKSRVNAVGHWIDVPFSAANFGATGGTWTVAAGNISRFSYALIGKTALIQLYVDGTVIGGTPTSLNLVMPFTLAAGQSGVFHYYVPGIGATEGVYMQQTFVDQYVRLWRDLLGTAYVAGSNVAMRVSLTVQIL